MFKSYGLKSSVRANILIRSSLLWLTCDQVFLFDVQRSTSSYCMREQKHVYCSGQSYSASSSVQSQLEFLQHVRFPGFAHTRNRLYVPRVLHFSAIITILFHIVQCYRLVHTELLVKNISVLVSFLSLHVFRVILLSLGLQHATYYHNLYTLFTLHCTFLCSRTTNNAEWVPLSREL